MFALEKNGYIYILVQKKVSFLKLSIVLCTIEFNNKEYPPFIKQFDSDKFIRYLFILHHSNGLIYLFFFSFKLPLPYHESLSKVSLSKVKETQLSLSMALTIVNLIC